MEVGAFDAKNTLGSLLDRVEKGEEVIITRRGKPVARLVAEHAPKQPIDIAAVRRAAALSRPCLDSDGLSFVERMRQEDRL